MDYTHVGRLGLMVSRLCLGTMNFGPHTSEEDSHTILDTAVAYGINFVDTANVYGRHGRVQDRVAVLLGRVRTEVHRAEAEPGDDEAETADVRVLHGT